MADMFRAGITEELDTIIATLNEPGVPVVTRVTSTAEALLRLRDRIARTDPGQHLTWHEGSHGWLAHDGYPRHKHALNGHQVTGENGPYLKRRSSAQPEDAMLLRLGEVLHTLGGLCDAPGISRRFPADIARWLRTGENP